MVSGVPFWLCQEKTGVRTVNVAAAVPSSPCCLPLAAPGTAGAQRAEWLREKNRRCGPEPLPTQVPRSRRSRPRGLTSIQQHQGSQHQERSRLPHELVEHTPKGGAHCEEEERGCARARDGASTPPGQPSVPCLGFVLNTTRGGRPQFPSVALSCPDNFLRAVLYVARGQDSIRVTLEVKIGERDKVGKVPPFF